MKKTILLFTIILLSSSSLFAQFLPHYMTDAEKELLKTYQFPTSNSRDNNPPPGPVRTMAEWEECQGIMIKWMSFTPILTEIVRYASQEGLVFIFTTDSNSVKTALTNAGISLTNIRYPRGITTGSQNSIWARDYGPWAIYSGVADTLRLVDWIYNRPRPGDDTNSVTLSQFANIPLHRTLVAPNDLVNTGGNFMVDGNGTAFASSLILNENAAGNSYGVSAKTEAQINSIVDSYMGIKRYIKMPTLPYDQIHHIDMHIKLIDEETLLVSQYPTGVADGPQIELNIQYILNNFQTCYGKPYKIVRIPAPPAANGQYPNTGADYRTYTNSLIINKTVLVPIYASSYDTTALRIYRENMPGYKVYGINCNTIIPSLGAIHCITKEIGVTEPVFISTSALRNTTNQGPQPVKAFVRTKSGTASATLYWRTDTTQAYTPVPMVPAPSPLDSFYASIPGQTYGKTVYYYISGTSNSGRTVTKPLTASVGGYMKYKVMEPTSITGYTSTALSYDLKQNFPNPFNPSTKINYSIPNSEFITLKIYDVNGKEVSTLVNLFQTSGSYEYTFNAASLSSGIYFYKLSAGNYVQTKSMLLIK